MNNSNDFLDYFNSIFNGSEESLNNSKQCEKCKYFKTALNNLKSYMIKLKETAYIKAGGKDYFNNEKYCIELEKAYKVVYNDIKKIIGN
jgi:hypothetical protein